jgi:hypothetical protein
MCFSKPIRPADMRLFARSKTEVIARREESAETFALALRLNGNFLAEA